MEPKPSTQTTVDRSAFTITFRRRLEAPREDVFDAWTQPALLAQWWDPDGARLRACEVDLRPGGTFRFANESHAPEFFGQYVTIDRPGLLEFTAMGAVGTVLLAADGACATQMTVTIRCASAEHLTHFLALGVAEGTERTLDNLVAMVARRAA